MVKDSDLFEALKAFVETRPEPARATFRECVEYLDTFREGTCEAHIIVRGAIAPNSFYWELYGPVPKAGGPRPFWMNGECIHYPAAENGVGGPQFSVSLGDTSKERWEHHT
jgi:hypothetical protein